MKFLKYLTEVNFMDYLDLKNRKPFAQYLKTPRISFSNPMVNKLRKNHYMSCQGLSEIIEMLFDPDVEIGDIADEMDTEIPRGGTAAWEKKREKAKRDIMKATQEALKLRGLPDRFLVFRGGNVAHGLVPVTLDPHTAKDFATFGDWEAFRTGTPHKPIHLYSVERSKVVADVTAIRGIGSNFESEQELLVWEKDLKEIK